MLLSKLIDYYFSSSRKRAKNLIVVNDTTRSVTYKNRKFALFVWTIYIALINLPQILFLARVPVHVY